LYAMAGKRDELVRCKLNREQIQLMLEQTFEALDPEEGKI